MWTWFSQWKDCKSRAAVSRKKRLCLWTAASVHAGGLPSSPSDGLSHKFLTCLKIIQNWTSQFLSINLIFYISMSMYLTVWTLTDTGINSGFLVVEISSCIFKDDRDLTRLLGSGKMWKFLSSKLLSFQSFNYLACPYFLLYKLSFQFTVYHKGNNLPLEHLYVLQYVYFFSKSHSIFFNFMNEKIGSQIV